MHRFLYMKEPTLWHERAWWLVGMIAYVRSPGNRSPHFPSSSFMGPSNEKQIGRIHKVLIEGTSKRSDDFFTGRSEFEIFYWGGRHDVRNYSFTKIGTPIKQCRFNY